MRRLEQLLGAPVALEQLKHKPGRRRTLRARGSRREAIVKLYASDRSVTVAERIAALAGGPPDPAVPRLLASAPARHMVVLSDVPGQPLTHALLGDDGVACRHAGEALGRWHRAWRGRRPEPLRPHGIERELEILRRRAATASSGLSEAVREVAATLAEPWTCSTVVHRDLYEEQILMAGEAVGLIDLDDAALGPPELDAGNLLAHVDLLSLRSGRDLRPMTDRLLAGYAESGGELDCELLDRCRLLAKLRLACIHDEPSFARAA